MNAIIAFLGRGLISWYDVAYISAWAVLVTNGSYWQAGVVYAAGVCSSVVLYRYALEYDRGRS